MCSRPSPECFRDRWPVTLGKVVKGGLVNLELVQDHEGGLPSCCVQVRPSCPTVAGSNSPAECTLPHPCSAHRALPPPLKGRQRLDIAGFERDRPKTAFTVYQNHPYDSGRDSVMDTTARRLFTPEPHGQSPTEPTADHRAAVLVASGAWVEEFVFRFLLVFFVFLLPRRFARKTNAGTQRNRLCKLFLKWCVFDGFSKQKTT